MKPNKDQMGAAVAAAEQLRDKGVDKHHLGRSLLYLQRRNKLLEQLLEHIELYLQFGLPEEEHAKLKKLLEEIRRQEHREGGVMNSDLGLS